MSATFDRLLGAADPGKQNSLLDKVKNLVQEEIARAGKKLGFLGEHIAMAPQLVPEISRVDLVTFELRVGAITWTPPANAVRINADYDFELCAIMGSCQDATTHDVDIATINFNMRESGRNFDIFTTAINMAMLVTQNVGPNIISFDRGLYLFSAGHEIQPVFARTASGALATWAAADASVYITLVGNLHKKR